MTVTISSKYQVVIPEEVRNSLDIRPGMKVSVIRKGGIVYLVPVRTTKQMQEKFINRFKATDLKGFREKKDRKI